MQVCVYSSPIWGGKSSSQSIMSSSSKITVPRHSVQSIISQIKETTKAKILYLKEASFKKMKNWDTCLCGTLGHHGWHTPPTKTGHCNVNNYQTIPTKQSMVSNTIKRCEKSNVNTEKQAASLNLVPFLPTGKNFLTKTRNNKVEKIALH